MTGKTTKVIYGRYYDRTYLMRAENSLFKMLHPNYKPMKPGVYKIRAIDVLGTDDLGNPVGRVNDQPSYLTGTDGLLLLKSAPEHGFKVSFITHEP